MPARAPRPADPPTTPPSTLLRRLQWTGAGLLALLLAWAALAPLRYPTRELAVEFARGGRVPATLHLTLGVRDVLLLKNRDRTPHVFGQVRVAPGHVFRLPFEQAGVFPYACDAALRQQVAVRVVPYPDPGWERLAWRLRALAEAVRMTAPRPPQA